MNNVTVEPIKQERIKRIATSLERVVYPITKILFYAGAIMTLLMMFFVVADVTMRYGFNRPIFGSLEIVGYFLAIVVAFTIPHGMAIRAHIAIDTLTSHIPPKARTKVHILVYFLCLITVGIIAWWSFVRTLKLWQTGQQGVLLYVPFSPFMFILFIGFTLFFFVVLIQLLHFIGLAAEEVRDGTK
jgi:TRAP-type C4-dicarboxylate transport system permease small subunit